jgi:hypothetical protein
VSRNFGDSAHNDRAPPRPARPPFDIPLEPAFDSGRMIHLDPAHIAPDHVPAPADAPASARARIEGQLVMLDRLAQIGMELAEACGREAKAPPSDAAARPHPGLVFARVARAVRMTIALQSRLMKDLAALDRADEVAERARTTRRRVRLAHLVEDAARAKVAAKRAAGQQYWDDDHAEDEIEQLSSEAYERLIDAEDGDLTGRPFSEAAAGICADLGLSPDWTARLLAAAQPPPGPSTSPIAAAMAGGGPSAEEPMVEGESPELSPGPQRPWPAPSTVPSSGAGPPPATLRVGEVAAPPRAPP